MIEKPTKWGFIHGTLFREICLFWKLRLSLFRPFYGVGEFVSISVSRSVSVFVSRSTSMLKSIPTSTSIPLPLPLQIPTPVSISISTCDIRCSSFVGPGDGARPKDQNYQPSDVGLGVVRWSGRWWPSGQTQRLCKERRLVESEAGWHI